MPREPGAGQGAAARAPAGTAALRVSASRRAGGARKDTRLRALAGDELQAELRVAPPVRVALLRGAAAKLVRFTPRRLEHERLGLWARRQRRLRGCACQSGSLRAQRDVMRVAAFYRLC